MQYWIMVILSLLVTLGCTKKKFTSLGRTSPTGQEGQADGVNADSDISAAEEMVKNSSLVWKRYRSFENGLLSGLQLAKAELCQEAGQFSCIDKVHLTVLGGNEPFVNAQYEPLVKPSVLTSVAVERVLLSACTKRAELDKAAGQGAVVFRHFPLSSAAASAEQAQPLIIDLYQRLLARDPSPEELNIATSFAAKFPQGEQLAIGLCVAIGSSVENVFL